MVAAPPTPAPVRLRPPWVTVGIMVAAAAFSLGVGYYQLFGLHELHAVLEYDDGVWFGSAVRLAHGVLPYRSFVLDQPPGVPLLLAPIGLLSRLVGTRDAFGVARLVTPVVGAVSVAAVGWLVRYRGPLAVTVGSGVAAVYPETLIDTRTVMLEPFCSLLCLLGLVGVFAGDGLSHRRRRLAFAGAAFGLAASCKLFALLPFAVVVLGVAVSRRRQLWALLAGAAGAAAAVCGPFLVLAPRQFFHQVVVTQLQRSEKSEPAIWDRVFSLVGLLPGTGRPHGYPDDSDAAVVAIVAAIAVLVLGGWAVRAAGRARRPHLPRVAPLDLVAVGSVVVIAVALVQPPAYYGHYAAFFAPFFAIALGLAAGNLGGRLPLAVTAVAVVALAAGALHAVHTVQAQRAAPFDAAGLDALIPPGACVISDNPPVLILADRFTSSAPGCPAMVDAYGTTISAGAGDAPDSPRADHNGAVAAWRRLFSRARYVVLASGYKSERIPWTAELRASVRAQFRTLSSTPVVVLVRLPAETGRGVDSAAVMGHNGLPRFPPARAPGDG
jgi:Glycosyltransferase family 87